MTSAMIVDSDTHVCEPPDVWTSAVAAARRQEVPHVRRDRQGLDVWYIGDQEWSPIGKFGLAGTDYPWGTEIPRGFDDLPPATWNATQRLHYMDENGILAQVVYPNVGGFAMSKFSRMDRELALQCVRIYNDWVNDWARPSGGRLIPVGTLPLWDMDETLREAERVIAGGQRAVLFPQHPKDFGLPHINEPHWDPLWRFCDEADVPINFHVGVGSVEERRMPIWPGFDKRTEVTLRSTLLFTENISGIANLVFSGILQRFPRLKFVSVESGVGYVPYLLEACDWQYQGARLWESRPEFELLPSEYCKRQVYFTYWFEQISPERLLDWIGADHVMIETDFPHPTSLSHAAGLRKEPLSALIDRATGFLASDVKAQVMWKTAAQLYKVQVPTAAV